MHIHIKGILTLSILGVLMPFIGIPLTWKVWLSAIFAFVVLVLGYRILMQFTGKSTDISAKRYSGEPAYVDARPEEEETVKNETPKV